MNASSFDSYINSAADVRKQTLNLKKLRAQLASARMQNGKTQKAAMESVLTTLIGDEYNGLMKRMEQEMSDICALEIRLAEMEADRLFH